MSDVRCAHCLSTDVDLLDFTSLLAYVYYYRCDVCGYVWTAPKNGDKSKSEKTAPRLALDVNLHVKDVLDAPDLIAEQLRTKGAITLQDLEMLRQRYARKSSQS